MKKSNKRVASTPFRMSFCDIGEVIDALMVLLPIQKDGFQDMVVQIAAAVDVAGSKDIASRLADEAQIPIEAARAVVRALRVLAKSKAKVA